MTVSYRLLLTGAALLVLLGACNRDRDEPAAPPAAKGTGAQVTPADAAAPMAYESDTPFAKVKLTLPEAVRRFPGLHARLYSAGVRDLRQFTEGAQADRTEFGGDENLPPYERSIVWTRAVETGKLLSLRSDINDYSGGAHPNAAFGSSLWDKAMQRAVEPALLFRTGADLTPLDRALCAAVNAEKRARDPQATPVALGATGMACPKALETPFVLTPSTTPGRAGGLTFLIGAYQVGAYAEGSYEVALPHTAFATLIAPAYAGEFAGEPVKAAR